jgi:hypothetical protein
MIHKIQKSAVIWNIRLTSKGGYAIIMPKVSTELALRSVTAGLREGA